MIDPYRKPLAFMCPVCDEYLITWGIFELLAVSSIQQGLAWLHNGDYYNACRNAVLITEYDAS